MAAIGCDISLGGVLKAKRFAEEKGVQDLTYFVVCSAERLPFKDAAFHKMSSVHVLEHLYDDIAAVAEIGRVVRDRAFISVPNTYYRMWPIFWLPYYIHDKRIGHLRHYSEKDLVTKFSGASFRCTHVHYSGHLVKFLQFFLAKLLRVENKQDSWLWWKLENADLNSGHFPFALTLNCTFARAS